MPLLQPDNLKYKINYQFTLITLIWNSQIETVLQILLFLKGQYFITDLIRCVLKHTRITKILQNVPELQRQEG
jgi:hypothetical protein